MTALVSYVGMFLLSLLVTLLAALQLADYFGATEEFILVLVALPVFVGFAMAVFTIAAWLARRVMVLDIAAVALAALAFMPVMLPAAVHLIASRSSNPYSVGRDSFAVTIELIVPAVIGVLVQWGLIRRRWLWLKGQAAMTRWPWIATGVAGLTILNPFGLDLLGQALTYHPGNMMRDLARAVAFGGIAALIAIGAAEYYIRGRMLRRRQPPAEPANAPG